MNSPPLSELKQSDTMKLDALTPNSHHTMESANTKFEAVKPQERQLKQSTNRKMKSTNMFLRTRLPVLKRGIFNMSLRTTAAIIATISLIPHVYFLLSYIDDYLDVRRTVLSDTEPEFGREIEITVLLESMPILVFIGCLFLINLFFLIGVLQKITIFILPWFYCAGVVVFLFCYLTFLQLILSIAFYQLIAAIGSVYSIHVVHSYIKQLREPSRKNNIYSERLLLPDSILVTNDEKTKLNNEYSPQSNNDVPLIDNMIKPTDSCIA